MADERALAVPLSRVERAVVVLALLGLCRAAYFHLVVEPRTVPRAQLIDDRYRSLRALLPAQGEVGYLSDEPPAARPQDDPARPGTRLYEEAQFALAPLVLKDGDDRAAVVVAQVRDPERLPSLAFAHGLRVVAKAGPGLAVLAR